MARGARESVVWVLVVEAREGRICRPPYVHMLREMLGTAISKSRLACAFIHFLITMLVKCLLFDTSCKVCLLVFNE